MREAPREVGEAPREVGETPHEMEEAPRDTREMMGDKPDLGRSGAATAAKTEQRPHQGPA